VDLFAEPGLVERDAQKEADEEERGRREKRKKGSVRRHQPLLAARSVLTCIR
jgi:hypothetical protein